MPPLTRAQASHPPRLPLSPPLLASQPNSNSPKAASSNIPSFSANAGDAGSIPGSGRSRGEGNGSPLQYSCLGHPTGRGAWGLQPTHADTHSKSRQLQNVCSGPLLCRALSTSQSLDFQDARQGRNVTIILFAPMNRTGRGELTGLRLHPGCGVPRPPTSPSCPGGVTGRVQACSRSLPTCTNPQRAQH